MCIRDRASPDPEALGNALLGTQETISRADRGSGAHALAAFRAGRLEAALWIAPGPVAVSRAFDTFEEVIEQANRLPYGLAAFAFTENGRRANLLGDAIEAGMVGINTFALSTADAPFGGVKDSGFGSEGGKEGLESYQVVKAIHQA